MSLLTTSSNLLANTVSAGGYTFSWTHILIALAAVFIIFKLIAFQIEMMFKVIIAIAIAAAAVYFIYYQ